MFKIPVCPLPLSTLSLITLVLTAGSSAVAQNPVKDELTVFAAASLTGAFREIGNRFEAQHPGVTIRFNFGGSQQLVQQIVEGARADILASANVRQMTVAGKAGVIDTATIRTFARNVLVMAVPAKNPSRLRDLKDLAREGVKIVLADSSVPAGQYAVQVLDRCSGLAGFGSSFRHDVLKNVVSYEENVRAVLSKVRLGECDAGIVYASDIASDSSHDVLRIAIPDSLNVVAEYPVAVVKEGRSPRLAEEFLKYLLSPEASHILADYGFMGGR
jgi:molybdate transport system substrate-binding protein